MIPKMKAQLRPKEATKTINRGRKPIADKKKPVRVWRTSSEIEQLGGEIELINKLNNYIDTIL